jgi:hypothetical protein
VDTQLGIGMARSPRVPAVGAGRESCSGSPSISIEGIEATQAIQFYRSGSRLAPGTAEPDNAIPLIAGKPVVIRVYTDLRVGPALEGTLSLEGEAWFREADGAGPWRPAWRFPAPVPGKPAARIERGRPADTLNFRIDGRDAAGRLQVRARVEADVPGAGRIAASVETALSFIEAPPLRIWIHGIRCRAGGIDLPAPTPAEALETLAFVRKTYPVARIEVAGHDALDFEGDFQGSTAAGPGAGWRALLLRLYRLRRAGGGREIHYGLLPRDAPTGPFGGYGSHLGVAASRAGEPTAMAQEIGHALGRKHAPGSGDPEVDPSYPDYGGPPGSIGEYGFDTSTGDVFRPDSASDFMTNRGRYWVSPHTYRGILEALLAREDGAGGAGGEARAPGLSPPPAGLPGAALAVEITSPRLPPPPAIVSGEAEVRWRAACADPRGIAFQLRYSADGGRTWTPVDAGLEYGRARLDFDRLPGGDDSSLQVTASTLLERAAAEIGPFRVLRKPRRAMIAGAAGSMLAPGGFIELLGCAHSADGFAGDGDLVWRSSIQGLLGTGSALFVAGLLPGEHRISLVAPDGVGGETRAEVSVIVPHTVAGKAR